MLAGRHRGLPHSFDYAVTPVRRRVKELDQSSNREMSHGGVVTEESLEKARKKEEERKKKEERKRSNEEAKKRM